MSRISKFFIILILSILTSQSLASNPDDRGYNSDNGSFSNRTSNSYGNGYNRNSNNNSTSNNQGNGNGNTGQRNNTITPNKPTHTSGFFPLGSDIRDSRPYSQQNNRRPPVINDPTHPRYAHSPNYNALSDKEARLRSLVNDPKVSSADRGWIKQETNRVDRNRHRYPVETYSNMNRVRNPPGKELAHAHGQEKSKGYGYAYTALQNPDLHKAQHRFDKGGQLNNERIPPAYQ
uniref:Bacterial toxin 8 domain-containing protein n=1 Tax=mine drainage metagenome TaxID=410659 RepID=E6QQZ4_9ZZZZ